MTAIIKYIYTNHSAIHARKNTTYTKMKKLGLILITYWLGYILGIELGKYGTLTNEIINLSLIVPICGLLLIIIDDIYELLEKSKKC